jgi:gamma-butyrobetaine dioxygenase
VEGGTSVFVDAIAAAETLRQTHPEYFDILTSSPVAFHYINDGHHLHYEHPTIELASLPSPSHTSALNSYQRQISHINYSPPFQAPLPLYTPRTFFSALKQFTKILNDAERTYMYTLKEGDAVLFDNRRVLHARTAFHDRGSRDRTNEVKEGEPNRWLKGCYLEADAIMDRRRVLERNKDLLV